MTVSALDALEALKEGNRRFAADKPLLRFAAQDRRSVVDGQRPRAVVVGCSDSRVPVETVFDSGVGELFVVRTAGHVMTAASYASVRFAVEKLGTRLIVVLGHEDCGAVTAALAGGAPDWLRPIVDEIDVSQVNTQRAPADADDELLAAAVDDHVRDTVRALREFVAGFDRSDDEPVLVAGGAYKLSSGEVHWLD